MTDWRPEIIKFVMYPTMYPTLAPCVQTRRTIRSIRSRHSTHFCHSTQYSRLCSTFFNLEHVCSVINTSTWWPRKRKRSKSFLGVHVQKERSVKTNRFVPIIRWLRYMGHIIWPGKVPLVKIIGKLDTMKDKHNVLMTCFDW